MSINTDDLTEFDLIQPSRVDAVGKPANGIEWLLMKAADDPDEAVKSFVSGLCGTERCPVCHDRYAALKETLGKEAFVEKATMHARERNALDASDFAFPAERKDPLNDEGHVRSALGRFGQTEGVTDKKGAARRIIRAAHKYGIEVDPDSQVAEAAKETSDMECTTCHGSGKIKDGNMDCPDCGGSGTMSEASKDTAPDKAIPTAEAESQTHEVEVVVPPETDTAADDGGEPKHVADAGEKPPPGDGEGDTAPNTALPTAEAESQTHDNAEGIAEKGEIPPADVSVTDALQAVQSALDRAKAAQEKDNDGWKSGKTEEMAAKDAFVNLHGSTADAAPAPASADGSPDADPGSPAWEAKDAALADKASRLILIANELITSLGNRERAEKSSVTPEESTLLKQIEDLISSMGERPTTETETPISKEIDNMNETELAGVVAKMLDERDEARRLAKKKAKKEKKSTPAMETKPEGEGDEEMAAKGAEASKAAAEVTDPRIDALLKQIEEQGETLAKIAAEDGRRIPLNETGFAAVLRTADGQDSMFKAFEDEVVKAENDLAKAREVGDEYRANLAKDELRMAKQRLTSIKMIAGEHARERDPSTMARRLNGQGVQVISNSHAIGEDSKLRYAE